MGDPNVFASLSEADVTTSRLRAAGERFLSWVAPLSEPAPARRVLPPSTPRARAPAGSLPRRIAGMIAAILMLHVIAIAAMVRLLQSIEPASAPGERGAEIAEEPVQPLDRDLALAHRLAFAPPGLAPAAPPVEAAEPGVPAPRIGAAPLPDEGVVDNLPSPADPGDSPGPPAIAEAAETAPVAGAPLVVAEPTVAAPLRPLPVKAAVKTQLAALSVPADPASGEAWVQKQKPGHYTLQLLSSRYVDGLQKFASRHELNSSVVYIRSLHKGSDLYSLLYGVYPTMGEAIEASKALMDRVQGERPWVRKLASIQAQLRPEPPLW